MIILLLLLLVVVVVYLAVRRRRDAVAGSYGSTPRGRDSYASQESEPPHTSHVKDTLVATRGAAHAAKLSVSARPEQRKEVCAIDVCISMRS